MLTSMDKTIEDLEKEIRHLREIIATMILWIAQSANAPISRTNAERLIIMLEDEK
jgi:hypothetical protein